MVNQPITHPLPLNTNITATKKQCACRGQQKTNTVSGAILKIIKNHQGYWYYLSSGNTVRDINVISVNHN